MKVKNLKCDKCGLVHKEVLLSTCYDVKGNGVNKELLVWQCSKSECKTRNTYSANGKVTLKSIEAGAEVKVDLKKVVDKLTPAQKAAITRAKNKAAKELEE